MADDRTRASGEVGGQELRPPGGPEGAIMKEATLWLYRRWGSVSVSQIVRFDKHGVKTDAPMMAA